MHNNKNDMDSLFSQKFDHFEVEPPVQVWDKLEHSMGKKRKAAIWWWATRTGIAASLVIAFATGWYFAVNEPLTDTVQTIADQSHINEENSDYSINNLSAPEITLDKNPTIETVQSQTIKPVKNTNQFASNQSKTIIERNIDIIEKQDKVTDNEPQQHPIYNEKLIPMLVVVKNQQSSNYQLLAMNTSKGLSHADLAIIAANLEQQGNKNKQQQKQTDKWSVGAQASPAYRFDEFQLLASNKAYDYAPSPENPSISNKQGYKLNVAGGLNVSYQASKKFSLQSGIHYTAISQTDGNIPIAYAGHNWVSNRNDYLYQDAAYSTPAKTSRTENTAVNLNTNMGLANVTLPDGAEVAVLYANSLSQATWAQNYRIEQLAGYIEVPFTARYTFYDNIIGMHLLGGLNANILVSNNILLTNQQNVLAKGHIEGLSPFVVSSSMGLGINYKIGSKFNLSIEPVLKIMLNDLNTYQGYLVNPYTLGVYTGISYFF